MKSFKVLYLSYDGMTDPLGQSQVLPYIVGLSQAGYRFDLISFEKKERFEQHKGTITQICTAHQIIWHPLPFSTRPPLLSKLWDVYRMKRKAEELHLREEFYMTHCRSYQAAEVGLFLKQKYGVKFFFDMRGFWVDERVDGGMWNIQNPLYKWAYTHYKSKEASYIKNADLIISLTEEGKQEMQRWPSYADAPIEVIPCSADIELFSLTSDQQKRASKKLLGIPEESLVMGYLGSIGTWYMLDEMLTFFSRLLRRYPEATFLFITPDSREKIIAAAAKQEIPAHRIVTRFAKRKEVSTLMKAADFGLFFIKQAYSKIASSPTKLGELFAMGIPVICNGQVGDVEKIVTNAESGLVIQEFTEEIYDDVIDKLPAYLQLSPAFIRAKAVEYYSLDNAIAKYITHYQALH